MGVGDGAVERISIRRQLNAAVFRIGVITFDQVFLRGVCDLHTFRGTFFAGHTLVLGQPGPGDGVGAVAVVLHRRLGVGDLHPVFALARVQVHHGQVLVRSRTVAVHVILVRPGLGDLDIDLGGLVRVGQGSAVSHDTGFRIRCISDVLQSAQILMDRILNLLAGCVAVRTGHPLILGQTAVGDGVGVVAVVGDGLLFVLQTGDFFFARVQGDDLRVFLRRQAQAVAVVIVVPRLGDLDVDKFGFMLVGNHPGARFILDRVAHLNVIVQGHLDEFLHGVGDFSAAHALFAEGVLRQIGEFVEPRGRDNFSVGIHCGLSPIQHLLRHGYIVRIEDHGDLCGPHTVLVVIVVPDLLHRNFGHLRRVGVGDDLVSRTAIFAYRVCVGLGSIALAHGELDAVSRGLGDVDGGAFVVSGGDDFVHIVGVGSGALDERQSIPRVGPAVLLVQRDRIAVSGLGRANDLVQLHQDLGGTAVVLVVAVNPNLGHLDAGYVAVEGIGDGGQLPDDSRLSRFTFSGRFAFTGFCVIGMGFRQVGFHTAGEGPAGGQGIYVFLPCVGDLLAIGVINRHLNHTAGPAVGFGQLDRLDYSAVGLQFHGQRSGIINRCAGLRLPVFLHLHFGCDGGVEVGDGHLGCVGDFAVLDGGLLNLHGLSLVVSRIGLGVTDDLDDTVFRLLSDGVLNLCGAVRLPDRQVDPQHGVIRAGLDLDPLIHLGNGCAVCGVVGGGLGDARSAGLACLGTRDRHQVDLVSELRVGRVNAIQLHSLDDLQRAKLTLVGVLQFRGGGAVQDHGGGDAGSAIFAELVCRVIPAGDRQVIAIDIGAFADFFEGHLGAQRHERAGPGAGVAFSGQRPAVGLFAGQRQRFCMRLVRRVGRADREALGQVIHALVGLLHRHLAQRDVVREGSFNQALSFRSGLGLNFDNDVIVADQFSVCIVRFGLGYDVPSGREAFHEDRRTLAVYDRDLQIFRGNRGAVRLGDSVALQVGQFEGKGTVSEVLQIFRRIADRQPVHGHVLRDLQGTGGVLIGVGEFRAANVRIFIFVSRYAQRDLRRLALGTGRLQRIDFAGIPAGFRDEVGTERHVLFRSPDIFLAGLVVFEVILNIQIQRRETFGAFDGEGDCAEIKTFGQLIQRRIELDALHQLDLSGIKNVSEGIIILITVLITGLRTVDREEAVFIRLDLNSQGDLTAIIGDAGVVSLNLSNLVLIGASGRVCDCAKFHSARAVDGHGRRIRHRSVCRVDSLNLEGKGLGGVGDSLAILIHELLLHHRRVFRRTELVRQVSHMALGSAVIGFIELVHTGIVGEGLIRRALQHIVAPACGFLPVVLVDLAIVALHIERFLKVRVVVGIVQLNRSAHRLPIARCNSLCGISSLHGLGAPPELYGDFRVIAGAVIIVLVVPDLQDLQAELLGHVLAVGVGQGSSKHTVFIRGVLDVAQAVAGVSQRRVVLQPGVADFVAVGVVLGQAVDSRGPLAVGDGQAAFKGLRFLDSLGQLQHNLGIILHVVGVKGDLQLRGPQTLGVSVVACPGLCDNSRSLGLIGVNKGVGSFTVAAHIGDVGGQLTFITDFDRHSDLAIVVGQAVLGEAAGSLLFIGCFAVFDAVRVLSIARNGLPDGIFVGAGLGIGDFAEHRGAFHPCGALGMADGLLLGPLLLKDALAAPGRIGKRLLGRQGFRLQDKGENLVLRVPRSAAADLLVHLGLSGGQLIGVLDRQGRHIVRTVVVHGLNRQQAGFFGHGHDKLPGSFVVFHALGLIFIFGRFFGNVVVIRAGLGEFQFAKDTLLTSFNFDLSRIGRRHLSGINGRTIIQFSLNTRDGELEQLIRVIGFFIGVADDFLGHFGLSGHLVVGQDGQYHQGGGVIAGRAFGHGFGLSLDLRPFVPAVGYRILHPAVIVADAVFIHLLHADGDIGPVFLLIEFNAGLAGYRLPGRNSISGLLIGDFVRLAFQLAFQVDSDLQLIAVIDIALAVHQPPLGDRDAVLAGGVMVDELSFRLSFLAGLDFHSDRFSGKVVHKVHGADRNVIIAFRPEDFLNGIDAGHQTADDHRRLHGDGQQDLAVSLLQEEIIVHIVSIFPDHSLDRDLEFMIKGIRIVGFRCCHIVYHDLLLNGQSTQAVGHGEAGFLVALDSHSKQGVVQRDQAFSFTLLLHCIGDRLAILIFLGQIFPGIGPFAVNGQLHGFSDCCFSTVHRLIQIDHHRFGQRNAFRRIPDLGDGDLSGFRPTGVGNIHAAVLTDFTVGSSPNRAVDRRLMGFGVHSDIIDHQFLDGVDNGLAPSIHDRQVGELALAKQLLNVGIILGDDDGQLILTIGIRIAVGKQTHSDAVNAFRPCQLNGLFFTHLQEPFLVNRDFRQVEFIGDGLVSGDIFICFGIKVEVGDVNFQFLVFLGNRYLNILGRGVVGHAHRGTHAFSDGIHVRAGVHIGNVAELAGLALLDSDHLAAFGGHRNAFLGLHAADRLADGRQGEHEDFISVVSRQIGIAGHYLFHFGPRFDLAKDVGDGIVGFGIVAVLAVRVGDHGFQFPGFLIAGYRYLCILGCRDVFHAAGGCLRFGFGDGIQIYTLIVIDDIAELSGLSRLGFPDFAAFLRHRNAFLGLHAADRLADRRQGEFKGFVAVVGRVVCIADDGLGDFGILDNLMIVVDKIHGAGCIHRGLAHGQALDLQVLAAVIPVYHHGDGLRIHLIIGHAIQSEGAGDGRVFLGFRIGLSVGVHRGIRNCFSNGVGIGAGHCITGQHKLALIVLLEGQRGRRNARLGNNLIALAVNRRNRGHLEFEGAIVIVAFDRLLDGHIRVGPAVGQLGEEDQRGAVFQRGLDNPGRTGGPTGRNRIFHPAVGIHFAVFVHLIHADGHGRPVVSLAQGNGIRAIHANAVDVLPDRHFSGRISGPLQLDRHRQVIGHGNAAIHQPLLGNRDAVLASRVSVDQGISRQGASGGRSLRRRRVGRHVHLVLRQGSSFNKDHGTNVMSRCVDELCTGGVLHLTNGIGAHRNIREGDTVHIRRLEPIGNSAQRHFVRLFDEAIARGCVPGLAVDDAEHLHIEIAVPLVGIRVGDLLVIHKHGLLYDQLALIQGVLNGDCTRNHSAVCLNAIPRTGGIAYLIPFGYVHFDHLIGDLISVIVFGQVGPRRCLSSIGGVDGLGGIGDIRHLKRLLDGRLGGGAVFAYGFLDHILLIGTDQFYGERLAKSIGVIAVGPLLGCRHLSSDCFMRIGHFGDDHRRAGRPIHSLNGAFGHHIVGILAAVFSEGNDVRTVIRIDLGCFIRAQRIFLPIISVFVAIGIIGGHAADHIGPALGVAQFDAGILLAGLFRVNAALGNHTGFLVLDRLVQFDIDLLGTEAIAVVFVIPELGHGHAVRAGRELIGEGQIVAGGIQNYREAFIRRNRMAGCRFFLRNNDFNQSGTRIIGHAIGVFRDFLDSIGKCLRLGAHTVNDGAVNFIQIPVGKLQHAEIHVQGISAAGPYNDR